MEALESKEYTVVYNTKDGVMISLGTYYSFSDAVGCAYLSLHADVDNDSDDNNDLYMTPLKFLEGLQNLGMELMRRVSDGEDEVVSFVWILVNDNSVDVTEESE